MMITQGPGIDCSHVLKLETLLSDAEEHALSKAVSKVQERIMQITRKSIDGLIENKLPDGSRLLVDSRNERVIALNATAGAAWDACGAPTTASEVAENMRRKLGPQISEELVEEAIAQLREKDLITSTTPLLESSSRRAFIAKLGAATIPLVVAMTLTEQRTFAQHTGSGNSDDRDRHSRHHLWHWGQDGSGKKGCDGEAKFGGGCGEGLPRNRDKWR
jgi:hypothetical protein